MFILSNTKLTGGDINIIDVRKISDDVFSTILCVSKIKMNPIKPVKRVASQISIFKEKLFTSGPHPISKGQDLEISQNKNVYFSEFILLVSLLQFMPRYIC